MIPSGWQSTTLGKFAKITSGGTPDRSNPQFWGGGIPWVTTGEIGDGPIQDTSEHISDAGLKNSAAKIFPAGTLLMAMYGQGKTRGKISQLKIEAATNQACAAIIAETASDASFLLQNLTARYDEIRNLSNDGSQKNLSGGLLKALPLLLPPPSERDRIARILSIWDHAIETVEALIANAREQKRALMQSLLTGKRRLPGFEGEWTWSKFSEVFERVRNKNTVGDTNVLTISAQHGLISQTEYFNKVVASDDVRSYTLLQRGDFAYNKSYSDGYPFGAFKQLDRYDQGIVSSLYICFRLAGAGDDHDFMRHYFEAGLFNREVAAIAQEGARNHGLLNVSVVDFFDTSLHTPTRDEQRAIAAVINDAERKERMLTEQRDALREEKAALMQQLLTGKRRVKTSEGEDA